MKFLSKLAAKNLFRNKLRTLISIVVIAFAVMMVVVLRGFVLGMIDSMFELHIQYNSGHVKVIREKYEQKQRLLSLNYPVKGFENEGIEKMQQQIKELSEIKETIPRIKFGAAVSTKNKLITMMGWGVNPTKEVNFTDIEDYLVAGRMIKEGNKEIAVGTDLLTKLDAQVGDKLTIVYTTSWGSFKGSTVKIVGELDSGFKLLDEKSFYLPLSQAQKMLVLPDQATELLVETNNYRKVAKVMPDLKRLFQSQGVADDYLLKRWDQGNSIIQYLQIGRKIYNLIYIFVILLACLVVINTLLMIVKERRSEIGMLSALGLKSREILILFILEGLVLGVVGSFLGVIGGGIATKILSIVGIDYSAALADMEAELLMRPIFYPQFKMSNLIFSFILGVIVTTITAVIPAKKAADLNPTEALRN
ncbi:ABC transporter permease [Halanaerobacter jeridensis]|uniref:ABC transport system permease protein n=1 Tax=Halanaerobacter jeridensis TaxID=706427 RepID=A0A938XRA2_9FIRM|nr:FtsX-like permease family protein [Halanaerobacter jeridensis]MBM7555933.1 putative ABC transport system permease protein [Halanaerobacter jeridensis]